MATVAGLSTPKKSKLISISKPQSQSKEQAVNVRVVVRCRPPSEKEMAENSQMVISCMPPKREVRVNEKKETKVYQFDAVYSEKASQEEVYDDNVQPIVDEVLQGFNCTVFAYGQTGTGKTHTMEGKFSDDADCPSAGIIPRSVHTIFQRLQEVREYSVKVSFMELYNEELTDLMNDEGLKLRLFDDQLGTGGVMVRDLEEKHVNSAREVFTILSKCIERRRTSATLMNEHSSRSHAIFTITIHSKDSNEIGEDIIKTGKLHLVDLAGSECVGRSGVQDKKGTKEAGKINQSLLTLGRVINALVENTGYVPYRDSKLTRLLKESLGGCSKTVIVATISPSMLAYEETLSTLAYAYRAKNIKNKPEVNQKMTHKAYMNELLHQIQLLKRENEVLRQKNGIILPPEQFDELNATVRTQAAKLEEFQFTLDAKLKEYDELQDHFQLKSDELAESVQLQAMTAQQLHVTQDKLHESKVELGSTRISLDKESFITKVHTSTGEAMYVQSSQLKSTLEEAIDHTSRLHDKIDRKTTVEIHNKGAVQSFSGVHHEELSHIQQSVDALCTQEKVSFGRLKQNVESFMAQSHQHVTSVTEAFQNVLSGWAQSQTHSQELCSAYSTRAMSSTQSEFDSITATQRQLTAKLEELQQTASSIVATLHATVEAQQKQLAKLTQLSAKHIEDSQTRLSSFVAAHEQSIKALQDKVESSQQCQQQALSNTQAEVTAYSVDESDAIRDDLQQMMKNMQSMFAAFEQKRIDSLNSHATKIQQATATAESALQFSSSQIVTDLDSCHANVEHYRTSHQELAIGQSSERDAMESVLASQCSEQQQSLHSVTKSMSNGIAEIQNIEDQFVAQSSTSTHQAIAAHNEFQSAVTQLDSQTTQKRAELGAVHVFTSSKVVEHLSETCHQWSTQLDEHSNAVTTSQATTSQFITAAASNVTKLSSEDIKDDVPTGTTPMRKTFDYPSILKSLQTRQVILEEYDHTVGPQRQLDLLADLNDAKESSQSSAASLSLVATTEPHSPALSVQSNGSGSISLQPQPVPVLSAKPLRTNKFIAKPSSSVVADASSSKASSVSELDITEPIVTTATGSDEQDDQQENASTINAPSSNHSSPTNANKQLATNPKFARPAPKQLQSKFATIHRKLHVSLAGHEAQ